VVFPSVWRLLGVALVPDLEAESLFEYLLRAPRGASLRQTVPTRAAPGCDLHHASIALEIAFFSKAGSSGRLLGHPQ